MLTADLVRARTKGGTLTLTRLGGKARQRAVELADTVLNVVRERVGAAREEVKEAVAAIEVPPRERKLLDGLVKLVDDDCEYAEATDVDPVELRRQVFRRAAAARRELADGADFDRQGVLGAAGGELDLSTEAVEEALFGDLRSAHQLLAAPSYGAELLVERYERAEVQAVLLKAVRVDARVHCSHAGTARALFRKLKFHRLLHRIEELGPGEYRIVIDGPYSLFESVTKYGLQLALVLPALQSCDRLELRADVRWGKQRRELTFVHEHQGRAATVDPAADLPDDVRALRDAFARMESDWEVDVAQRVLDLPGVGLCVPDLTFRHPARKDPVYLEVLGYWSREAVWKRVELVESGLDERILFAVSARLRVSEAVLEERPSAALYVYKGTMSPRSIERQLNALARLE